MTAAVDARGLTRPKASFVCISYNHEGFVARCLDAFLAQEVDFDVEIIVHDDASTDRTREVLLTYAEAHPHRFTLLLPDVNSGNPGHALATALSRATGEFILFCDADDYWTDPRKAQTQVDHLGGHSEFAFSFHDAIRSDATGTLTFPMMEDGWLRDWSSAEVAETAYVYFCQSTLCFRNVLGPYPHELAASPLGDLFLARMLGHAGAGAYLGDRVRPTFSLLHGGGVWSAASDRSRDEMAVRTYLQLVGWLLTVGRTEEADLLTRRELLPRLAGTYGDPPPPPPFTWRHPGSILPIARAWWGARH